MSYNLLRETITGTKNLFQDYRNLDTSDSSYLISLVWKGTLYIANFGDSRLMIDTEIGDTSELKVEQLTTDKNLKLKI
jgi:serine/threonine protein phosphatase PrpC